MLKTFKMTLLSACAVAGLALYSCSKQNDPSATTTAVVTAQAADLVGTMAADVLVKDYVRDNEKFIGEYLTWYKGMTTAERNAYKASCVALKASGKALPDPSHTLAEVKAYNDLQALRMEKIKSNYPKLAKLESDDFETTLIMVSSVIIKNSGSTAGLLAPGCGNQYYACKAAGNSPSACWDALVSCVNTTYP